MGDWITSIAGTSQGERIALGLVLSAAVLDVIFGALAKKRASRPVARPRGD